MRTEYCGQLNASNVGQEVTLCGWVNRRRDLGGLIFIDMRDREGIVQVFFDPDQSDAFGLASELRNEFCIQITGTVRARPESQFNKDMATGEVEVFAHALNIINRSEPLPLDSNHNNTEEARLKYRYLDLRRPEMANRLKARAKITSFVRRESRNATTHDGTSIINVWLEGCYYVGADIERIEKNRGKYNFKNIESPKESIDLVCLIFTLDLMRYFQLIIDSSDFDVGIINGWDIFGDISPDNVKIPMPDDVLSILKSNPIKKSDYESVIFDPVKNIKEEISISIEQCRIYMGFKEGGNKKTSISITYACHALKKP